MIRQIFSQSLGASIRSAHESPESSVSAKDVDRRADLLVLTCCKEIIHYLRETSTVFSTNALSLKNESLPVNMILQIQSDGMHVDHHKPIYMLFRRRALHAIHTGNRTAIFRS